MQHLVCHACQAQPDQVVLVRLFHRLFCMAFCPVLQDVSAARCTRASWGLARQAAPGSPCLRGKTRSDAATMVKPSTRSPACPHKQTRCWQLKFKFPSGFPEGPWAPSCKLCLMLDTCCGLRCQSPAGLPCMSSAFRPGAPRMTKTCSG